MMINCGGIKGGKNITDSNCTIMTLENIEKIKREIKSE